MSNSWNERVELALRLMELGTNVSEAMKTADEMLKWSTKEPVAPPAAPWAWLEEVLRISKSNKEPAPTEYPTVNDVAEKAREVAAASDFFVKGAWRTDQNIFTEYAQKLEKPAPTESNDTAATLLAQQQFVNSVNSLVELGHIGKAQERDLLRITRLVKE